MLQLPADKKLIRSLFICGIILVLFGIAFHTLIENEHISDICVGVYPATIGSTLVFLSLKMENPLSTRTRLTPIYIIGGLTLIFGTAFCFFQMFFSSGGSGLLGFLGLLLCIVLAIIVALEQLVVRVLELKGKIFVITESILVVFVYLLLFYIFGMISG